MMKLSISTGISCGLVASILLISANSAMADQRHYQQNNQQYRNNHHQYQNQNQYHQHGGKRVEVTKEVTENGVIIHKTMTNSNGVTYTIDKVIEKNPHGRVYIDKK